MVSVLQYSYTDISAISVTFCNSDLSRIAKLAVLLRQTHVSHRKFMPSASFCNDFFFQRRKDNIIPVPLRMTLGNQLKLRR